MALRSMTGFSRVSGDSSLGALTIEMKSVNHRYLDISARLPKDLVFLEEDIKALLRESVSRGRVDISCKLQANARSPQAAEFNVLRLCEYKTILAELSAELGLDGGISLEYLLSLPGVMAEPEVLPDSDELLEQVKELVRRAVKSLQDAREAEGERLSSHIAQRLCIVADCVQRIEERSQGNVDNYRLRLLDNIKRLIPDIVVDPSRLEVEVAIFADRSNIAEEIVRLHAHIHNFRQFLVSEQAVGRKMDFYLQEMNREANTIGSKSLDVGISQLVVEIKSELEKIREQVQNLE